MQLASPHPPLISVVHSLLVQKHAHSSGVYPLFLLSCFSHLHCIITVLRALWSLDTFASTRELIMLPQTYVTTPPSTVRGIPFRWSCDSEGATPETPLTHENLLSSFPFAFSQTNPEGCVAGITTLGAVVENSGPNCYICCFLGNGLLFDLLVFVPLSEVRVYDSYFRPWHFPRLLIVYSGFFQVTKGLCIKIFSLATFDWFCFRAQVE